MLTTVSRNGICLFILSTMQGFHTQFTVMLNHICGQQCVNQSCYMDRIVSISVAQILKLWNQPS